MKWMLFIVLRSERPRRAAVVNYFADGVTSDSDQPMMNGLPPVKKVYRCGLHNHAGKTKSPVPTCSVEYLLYSTVHVCGLLHCVG